ncbi:MAG: hypothetical protein LBQ44_11180 [Treponema sp.]|jgi:hypothetical protein|nr:hypothetical protein [Treponema sp.]
MKKTGSRFLTGALLLFFLLILSLILSCADAPEPQSSETVPVRQTEAAEIPAEIPAVQPVFDPQSISKEEYNAAKSEVQSLIQTLNRIIRARNYNGWVSYLEAGYLRTINSREHLDRINKTERMVKAGITLNDARDYFVHVVVPSRANDRVDDIEYISHNRVRAFSVNSKGQRVVLYNLEHTKSGWKIIN